MKKIQTRAIVGVLALAMLTCAVAAQDRSVSRKAAQARDLTNAISERLRSQTKGRFDETFRRMAAERLALLSELAETNPGAVLQNSLPAGAISRIPADLAGLFERHGTFNGELSIEEECEEHDSRTHRYIRSGDDSKHLYLDSEPTLEMKTGDQIAVTGVAIDGKIVANAEQTSVTSSSTAALTTGEKRVLVILVNFQDKATQPFTVEHARDVTFNQTSNYIRENSYGQTWLTGDVYGWLTIPMSSAVCDTTAIANYANQAATQAGAIISGYNNIIYAFPSNACRWAGLGSLGGNPGLVWINNGFNINSVAHELGHNFGMYHSGAMDCGLSIIGTSCTTNEYGDIFDIMGGGAAAHTNLFQKERIGWVNSSAAPAIQTVTSSGTYWIDPYETISGGPKGLKILKSTDPVTGKKTWYYVERRTPYGFDSYMSSMPSVMSGVLIRSGSELNGRDGYLLDMTPETTSWYDAPLTVGHTFTDSTARISITTLSADATGATVRVEINSQSCERRDPSLSVTPGQSNWLTPGAPFSYSVTVTNNNSSGCAAESYALSANVPNGWSLSYSTTSLSVSPGSSASANIEVRSPTGTGDGVYGLVFGAGSGAYSATASAFYSIVTRLAVSATPSSSKYTRTQKANVTAVVSGGGSVQPNVPVVFTLYKPNGTTVTQTQYTSSDGTASFIYLFNRKRDPTGTYSVMATAASNGRTGQASASFFVNK